MLKLLLLDEPFSSLDISTKSHLYRAIGRLCDEFGLTLVVVSHDPLEAAALCSRAAVLEEGRIVETGICSRCCMLPHPRRYAPSSRSYRERQVNPASFARATGRENIRPAGGR